MRILMVSMNSIHFQRWSEQLRDSGHEIHWFNILGGLESPSLDFVTQYTGWKHRFKKGRYLFKKIGNKIPFLKPIFERNVEDVFREKLAIVQPDIVHSFALYVSCTPILNVMKESQIPWVYSSWGSDLFYFKDIPKYRKDIEIVLPEINYLFTDCHRDQKLAKELGFVGTSLGVFPGGGGFPLQKIKSYIKPIEERTTILVKGYQGRSGRAIPVLKALKKIEGKLVNYEIVVFGCGSETIRFQEESNSKGIFHKQLSHDEVLQLMGTSLLYIGNSNSDGMPNTLLEAMCLGAFPIQSNPGGATAEVITHGDNGFLIPDCEDVDEISDMIDKAINNQEMIAKSFKINQNISKQWDRMEIQQRVLQSYTKIKV